MIDTSRKPLPDDRRARILDAALNEFSARGFEAASTNAIAERAGVAKGLLFHHFGNKEELFVAVFKSVVEQLVSMVFGSEEELPADLFARLYHLSLLKLRFFQQAPAAYEFVTAARTECPKSVRARIDQAQQELMAKGWAKFMAGIDASKLRPGITLQSAIETLTLLGEGLERRLTPYLASLPDRGRSKFDEISKSAWTHFERLRDGLYRSTR